jgi:hypothetical protein
MSQIQAIFYLPASFDERIARDALDAPFVHADRAHRAVEVDRGLVPVEHRPLEPSATAVERDAREVPQQRGAGRPSRARPA